MKKKTTKEIIDSFHKTHGDKYDYSKVEYMNATTKVCIVCPEHGEFWQTPSSHLQGCGCPQCASENISKRFVKSNDTFVHEATLKHGHKYDYSKVEYKGAYTKICIICPKHGEFWQTPHNHLCGNGCPICGNVKTRKSLSSDLQLFVLKSQDKHNNKYDYSQVNYVNAHTLVKIVCPSHGTFYQYPTGHLSGKGCPICAHEKIGQLKRSTTSEFVEKAKIVHGDKYDYSKVNYNIAKDKVCILCPKHGEFYQQPFHHLAGCGCPKCHSSHMETEIRNLLIENNIHFTEQQKFDWMGLLRLDFYLPYYNVAIECQGIQHFEPIEYFGGEDALLETMSRDESKRKMCEINGIHLLYFTVPELQKYFHKNNVFTTKEQLINYLLTKKDEINE